MTIPEDTETTDAPEQPSIVATFAEHLSADVRITVTNCSPAQMWAVARMIDQYATDAWQANQMQQAMAEAKRAQSGIVPVRSIPGDHLRKRERN